MWGRPSSFTVDPPFGWRQHHPFRCRPNGGQDTCLVPSYTGRMTETNPDTPHRSVDQLLEQNDRLNDRLHLAQQQVEDQRRLIDSYQAAALNQPRFLAPETGSINITARSTFPSDTEMVGPSDVEPRQYLVVWRSSDGPANNAMMWHIEVHARSAYEAFEAVRYRDNQLGLSAELVGTLDLTSLR